MLDAPRRGTDLASRIAHEVRRRNALARPFFEVHAPAIAVAARNVAARLQKGGRIYAFGRGGYATDAQHLAVEFVHPVLVGKPALPAVDASAVFETSLPVLVGPADVAVGFGPPHGDPAVTRALATARALGAYTVALPGTQGDCAFEAATDDEHIHQEIVELVGHLLYESVHVFLEHRPHDGAPGAAGFLYPFLDVTQAPVDVTAAATASIRQKALDTQALRERVAAEDVQDIAAAARTIAGELAAGGRLLMFGNGGSATDATDFAFDCIAPPVGALPIAALSLAADPATLSAIANDVGCEFIFLRQLIAHIAAHDVAIALSTSGGSQNVIAALEEARKRGNRTVALLGYDGGEIARRGLADHAIVVHSDYIPRVQEAQATIYHTLRRSIDWVRRDGA